jgi:hypothetical protein
MRSNRIAFLAAIAWASLAPAPCKAEPLLDSTHIGSSTPRSPEYHTFRFRGNNGSKCGWFLLTEAGVLFSIKADPGHETDQAMIGTLDLGAMKNFGRQNALGATGFWESGSDHNRAGVRIRYRRWLGGRTALDLSPGIVVDGNDTFVGPGLIGQAALNFGDLMSVVVEGEVDRYEYIPYYYVGTTIHEGAPQRLTDTTFRAGLRGGSYIGMGATLVAGVVMASIASSFN